MKQEEISARLQSAFGDDVIKGASEFKDQISVTVAAGKILDVCGFLKGDPELSFDFLSFVGGVDLYPNSPRFEVVYQLQSLKHNHRFRIKAQVDETDGKPAAIDSVTGIWPTADWHERETAEMYGMVFKNHPDPRKLLLPDEWRVHPLRKDFPLLGTEEETPDLPRQRGPRG